MTKKFLRIQTDSEHTRTRLLLFVGRVLVFDGALIEYKQPKRCSGVSPGEHVARLLHLVAGHMVLHIWFVDPRLDVHNLLAVIV